ncbi:efflux RND transporter periplasmic adaptor subunit [Glaciecola sp. XM2]|uniref:efflux RND transporter periplasmic adaptor subunit n=1 Tax=Glaciecola sp. XM2 TaxID=1914931 RepID=UPI001BDE6CD0|nr:efflux RND transporter periplasmic adaptor subunit [Glaciecola sp. XM2]
MPNLQLSLSRYCVRRLFVYLVALATLSACSQAPEHSPITKSVLATTPVAANANTQRTLSGVLQSADQSTISFEIPGVIESVDVNLGDKITRGQLLASIDDKVFKLAVEQRKGQLSEANARLTEARIDFERKSQLFERNAISKAEVDVAKARFDSLQDQVNIARTQVEIAQEDLADTRLIAPFSGSVAQRHVEPSQQVTPSTGVLTIHGSNSLEAALFVPESLINDIQPGQKVKVEVVVDQKRQVFVGSVFEKGNQAQRANAFPVTVTLDAGEMTQRLQPGMSAEVTFSSTNNNLPANAMQAPLSVIGADANDTHYVMALEPSPDSQTFVIKKVGVELLDMNAQYAIFIPSQKLGDIVRTGQDFLRDGQVVFASSGPMLTINE